MKKVLFYRCDLCGNLFHVLEASGVNPVCCGQDMTVLKANTSDGAGEKHVPVIQQDGCKVKVVVGASPHVMTAEHWIMWIGVSQCGITQFKHLKPGDEPEAEFQLCCDKPVTAYEYCNLHGLWSSEG